MIELNGRVAVVTGGGKGMGRAICVAYARAGARVMVADLDAEAAAAVAEEIRAAGGQAASCKVNVSSKADAEAMLAAAEKTFGGVDILCNNAGVITKKFVEEMTEQDWDLNMNVNAKGVFLCSQAAIPHMKKRGGGRIISTASVSGKLGFEQEAHYCASKAAVLLFSKALALELAKYNILVNCVCPGNVETDMMRIQIDWENARTGESKESLQRQWTECIPLKRLARPEDIADMYLFLASDYAGYLTGDALNVTGGMVMI